MFLSLGLEAETYGKSWRVFLHVSVASQSDVQIQIGDGSNHVTS